MTGSNVYDSIPRSDDRTLKKEGKVALSGKTVMSASGRVLTISWSGKNTEDQPTTAELVYDKQ